MKNGNPHNIFGLQILEKGGSKKDLDREGLRIYRRQLKVKRLAKRETE